MTAKILQDVLRRVEDWPAAAQVELAEIALEIEAALGAGVYHAMPKELEGIDRGLKLRAKAASLATTRSAGSFRNPDRHDAPSSDRSTAAPTPPAGPARAPSTPRR